MRNKICDHEFIRNLIKGNNIIWYLMYYDELFIQPNHHLTLVKNADLSFYNSAQAVSAIDPDVLKDIEAFYGQHYIQPAFYLDPASFSWLQPFLTKHGYSEQPAERENWWGILLDEDITRVNFQDYLKIPDSLVTTKIINPHNENDLNQFLKINQITNQLPDHIVEKLRAHMLERVYPEATNISLIAYVNDVPASVRALGLYNNIAYLAEAGTLPSFRKLGLHTFTTMYFLRYAYEHRASVAALTCTQDSITNFTSKRAGFELLFQRQLFLKNRHHE